MHARAVARARWRVRGGASVQRARRKCPQHQRTESGESAMIGSCGVRREIALNASPAVVVMRKRTPMPVWGGNHFMLWAS